MEVLTPAEMDKADQLAIASGVSSFALMMSAGCQVAQAALDMAGSGSILVVCGRGNNGGDGFVAASELRRSGREVAVMLLCDRASLTGDAATAAANWAGDVLPFDPAQIGHPALIIDAIFGAGLNRAVKGDPESIIAAINDSGAPVLSVDLPSGVNGASGAVMGLAIRATETVTFFRHKPGHLLLPGRSHCGRVRLVDIGIASEVLREIRPATFENRPDLWERQFPIPTAEGHKYARGHAIVVSGGVASTGAARLCARGAIRIGAGLVTLASPRDALAVNAAALTAIMLHPADTPGELSELLSDKRLNACAIGPGAGVGGATSEKVLAILPAAVCRRSRCRRTFELRGQSAEAVRCHQGATRTQMSC